MTIGLNLNIITYMRKEQGYVPSPDHRFVVSDDKFSQVRFETVKRVWQGIHKEYPFVSGMTLFGSLSKGKELTRENLQRTDIDMATFIDVDDFLRYGKSQMTDKPLYNTWVERFETEESDYIMDDIRNLPSGSELPTKDVCRLRAAGYVIHEAVEKSVRSLLVGRTGFEFAPPARDIVDNLCRFISKEGPFSPLFSARRLHIGLTNPNLYVNLTAQESAIGAVFAMDIGGTMGTYKQSFVDQLQTAPGLYGEVLWQIARDAMIKMERRGKISPGLESQYPRTLEEAIAAQELL